MSFAQQAQVKPTYLVRIERLWEYHDVCLLVNHNGAYRLEKVYPGKTEVSAGLLSAENLEELRQLLDADPLRDLTQDKIGRPILGVALDEFKISIGREKSVQDLLFVDERSRQPFREATDPVIKWFHRAENLSGALLDESSASQCMPPPARSSLSNAVRQYPWIVQWTMNEMFIDRAERSCVIIYASGKFHREHSRQMPGRDLEGIVKEGELTKTQVNDLRLLTDSSDLANLPSQPNAYASWFQEGRFTEIKIPRGGSIQTLASSSYYKVEHNPYEAGGMSGMHNQITEGDSALKPLRKWLDQNILKSKLPTVVNVAPNFCRATQ
jgi:hypothetical protein